MKHTPGPWGNNGGLIGPDPDIFYHPTKYAICMVGALNHQTDQDVANARLIVEAPSLLEALFEIAMETGHANASEWMRQRALRAFAKIGKEEKR